MATDELAAKLARRNNIIDKAEEGLEPNLPSMKVFNVYTEFKEFSRKEIQHYQKVFNTYDEDKNKHIDINELRLMMEKLGSAQTHLGLKNMIKEVDEDQDGCLNFREFLLIFRKANAGELEQGSGLYEIFNQLSEVDVEKEGVKGAANFFAAKIDQQSRSNKFEEEIKQEQEERKREEEDKKRRRAEFKNKATFFQNQ